MPMSATPPDPRMRISKGTKHYTSGSLDYHRWFTWCQSCKHGGHAHHISEWFSTHSVCPVAECDCDCSSVD